MKKKFVIYALSYDENNGGSVVLHQLCSMLNELGFESYLSPYREAHAVNQQTWHRYIWRFIKWRIRDSIRKYNTNPHLHTPIFRGDRIDDDFVVIYPEIVFGNPLEAKNVVRWFLHQPGFHDGRIFYGNNELYFKFNSAIRDFHYPGSKTSALELKVIAYPLEHYNLKDTSPHRTGTAYCIRKGQGKPIQHDLTDSVLIDGKNHAETARIFKRVKRFISYDPLTAYSVFAVLCGCESVVIPDENVSVDEWYPNPQDRWGISYGFSHIDEARRTAHRVQDHVLAEHNRSKKSVLSAVTEIENHFKTTEIPLVQNT